uniref:Uncharacterized protein n=1 Tax=Tetraselmis sp. GSL018 TaxID=582737 RepID=A0A061RR17_9CHLO
MERDVSLRGGEWYSLRCTYEKISPEDDGQFGIRWRSLDGRIGGPLSGPYVRTGGASEVVAAAWIHPYHVEGRMAVMSIMDLEPEAEDDMPRIGIYIINGTLAAAFFVGSTCDSLYYREVRSWKSAIVHGEWQHIMVAYNGMDMMFFVDGRLTDVVTYSDYAYVAMGGGVQFLLGQGTAADLYWGQVESAVLYNKVTDPEAMAKALWECPIQVPEENLMLNLQLNEGAGPMSKNSAVNLQQPEMSIFGDGVLAPEARWVDSTCDTLGAFAASVEYAGHGLVEGLAGQCMVFSIQSRDKCGSRRLSGGDNFTVEVVGPLHLHTEIYELTVGHGIVDMQDGSYLVHFTREISGHYLVYVKLNGEIVYNEDGAEASKACVRPFVTDAYMSYLYDEHDMLGLDEVRESCAGIPVAYMIQTVDMYGLATSVHSPVTATPSA